MNKLENKTVNYQLVLSLNLFTYYIVINNLKLFEVIQFQISMYDLSLHCLISKYFVMIN